MIIYQILMIILLNVIVPILIGGLFQTDICKTKVSQLIYRYAVGFFVMLAIYQLLEVPMALLYVKFHVLVIVYSVILVLLSGLSMVKCKKNGSLFLYDEEINKNKVGVYGWIYLVLFIVVLVYQLYHTIFYQLGDMSLDDATYVAYANDAVQTDLLFLIDPYTGNYDGLSHLRMLQSSIVYPSLISKLTGIHVTVFMHTIWPIFLMLMAYGVYYLIAKKIFDKSEYQFLFLLLIALIYTFGLYSHYSTTFRILGVIWQGKGILAVILNFLYIYIFGDIYQKKYNRNIGILICIISIASMGLTLGGFISTVAISFMLFILCLIKKGNWENAKYLVWANFMPFLYAGFYLWQR